MVHHGIADKTIDYAEQIAYRLLDAAIAVAAFGLGPPVRMTVVAPSDTTEYDDIELRRVEDAVNTWRYAEAETLNAVVGGRELGTPDEDHSSDLSADPVIIEDELEPPRERIISEGGLARCRMAAQAQTQFRLYVEPQTHEGSHGVPRKKPDHHTRRHTRGHATPDCR